MAKRVRLTPPQPEYLAPEPAPETKALGAPFGARPAPIAQVAGDAAHAAALGQLGREIAEARETGRLAEHLPLAAIVADHLVRDRIAADPEEMAALTASIRARGQQTPIEVVELGGGRFGLISGWRRFMAIKALSAETGAARFATVLAVRRRPETASAAYVAMVEENEVRADVGHYARARIAATATEQGVFPDLQTALRQLYGNASRAKRSKMGSFSKLHEGLGDVLRFPAAIPERLGLALVKALDTRPSFADRARQALQATPPDTAAAEQALLQGLLTQKTPKQALSRLKVSKDRVETLAPGLVLTVSDKAGSRQITLSGDRVDAVLETRLADWLKTL